jgi:LysM repeat protein
MQWIKKHGGLMCAVALCMYSLFLVVKLLLPSPDLGTIKVQQGDTLWSLAEQYKGDMSRSEWIGQVKRENGLYSDIIFTGDELDVPNAHLIEENLRIAVNK